MCDCGTDNQSRGAALVIAMLVMAVLLMAGTTLLTISSTESQIALNEQASAAAFLVAEAGINKAIAQLDANSGYTGETNTSLGSGTFTVTVTTTSGCTATSARNLAATGSVPVHGGQAQVVVKATGDQVSYPFRFGAFAAVPNQIITDTRIEKELWLGEASRTDSFDSSLGAYNATVSGTANIGSSGDIGANGDITLDKNTVVNGNVRAGDTIHLGSPVTVAGIQASSLSPSITSPGEPFPSVIPSPPSPPGALNWTSGTLTLAAGTYYYTNLTFANGTSLATSGGPVTIYVTGPVISGTNKVADLGDNVTFGAHPGTNLRIITKSCCLNIDYVDFNAGNNFTFFGSLHGKNTDIYLKDDARIFGSMIGRAISTGKRAAIHFDQAMFNQEVCHNGKFNVRRGTWREVIL